MPSDSSLALLDSINRGNSAAMSENPKLLSNKNPGIWSLFFGPHENQFSHPSNVSTTAEAAMAGEKAALPKQSFWQSEGGNVVKSLLGTLALGGLGAGIGAIASPGARGLGAARGFGIGSATGLQQDIGMRKAAAGAPANLMDELLKQQQVQSQTIPTSYKEYSLAYPQGKNPQGSPYGYGEFLKEKQLNPLGLLNYGLSEKRFTAGESDKQRDYDLKLARFQSQNDDAINSLSAIKQTLSNMKSNLDKLEPGDFGIKGRLYPITSKVGLAPDAYQSYVTDSGLVLSNIARNLGGEKGVLTDQDVERVKNTIAQPWMSQKQRAAAWKEIDELLETRMKQATSKNALLNGINPQDIKGSSQQGEQPVKFSPESHPQKDMAVIESKKILLDPNAPAAKKEAAQKIIQIYGAQ